MKKITILMVAIMSLLSVCLGLTACGKDKKDNVIKVSEVTHSLFYAPLYIAMNNGYFADEGLEIELTNAGGSDAVTTALTSKSADIGLLGPEGMIYVRKQGMKNAPIIFAQLTACDGSFLVGRPDENTGEFSYNDLIGKHIIAGRKGGMPAMTLQYILEEIYDLTTGSEFGNGVDVVLDTTIAYNLNVPSFVAGTGDYCTMFEPTASQCELDGTGKIVSALGEEISDIPYTVFTSTSSFLNKNPEKIEKFMRALQKGYDYLMIATDTQLISALKPSFTTTSDELIVSAVRNYIRIGAYANDFVLSESSWTMLQTIMTHAGELEGTVAYTDAVNTDFAKGFKQLIPLLKGYHMTKVIEAQNLSLTYHSKLGETLALDNISFDVKSGEFISIVGPSGCGKTTILSILAGLLEPSSGTVLVNGETPKTKNSQCGYMFQRDNLLPWRTIEKNVLLGLEIQHKLTPENKARALSLLDKYGLGDFKRKRPDELSGGMRQRVALIRTLALNPSILLLDEPFSALDYQTRLNVCDDVANIIKQEKKTAILVTHDLQEAISMSDRIFVLSKRPANIKAVHKVNFDKSLTPFEKRQTLEAESLFNTLWEEIQDEQK